MNTEVGGCGGSCGCSGGSCGVGGGCGGATPAALPFPFSAVGQEAPPPTNGDSGGTDSGSHHFRFSFRYPYWGYNFGWPWYGLREQCYYDPRLGAWVCPTSPWMWNPLTSLWRTRPMPYSLTYPRYPAFGPGSPYTPYTSPYAPLFYSRWM